MNHNAIFTPVCAQVFLTFSVAVVLLTKRIGAIDKNKVHPQALADEAREREVFKNVVNISDNFENLFEVPVLFYVAALVIAIAGLTDQLYLGLAWAFVFFRVIHSIIHCTTNKVRHRFMAYLLSSVALLILWGRLAWSLLG